MTLHGDGWFKEYNVDLAAMPDDELVDLFKEIFDYQVLTFKKQQLTTSRMIQLAEICGKVQKSDGDRAQVWEDPNGILRVGGEALTGKPALFAHKHDLDWHANQPSNPNRKKLIWLYAVSGSKGSRTSWLNNLYAYDDLPADVKDKLENAKVYCGYQKGRYSDSPLFKDHIDRENPVPLVQSFGKHRGLFFPFFQIFEVVGWDDQEGKELIEYLENHILNEKYMVHWDWEDGDINVAEQVLTIHKRWAFENMGTRLLWRIAGGFENIDG